MDGLELLVIGRSQWKELRYEDGAYVDVRGRPIDGLIDRDCYDCRSSFYTFDEDPVPFCPSCGIIEREAFGTFGELAQRLMGQDWGFLAYNGKRAFGVSLPRGGWALQFARDADEILRTGRFGAVRAIHPPA
jgi:hypothetical protein